MKLQIIISNHEHIATRLINQAVPHLTKTTAICGIMHFKRSNIRGKPCRGPSSDENFKGGNLERVNAGNELGQ
jgi:hypothetical protein